MLSWPARRQPLGARVTTENANKFRRRLSEFAVIVVGVLVALWIDAGWAWLQDRDRMAKTWVPGTSTR